MSEDSRDNQISKDRVKFYPMTTYHLILYSKPDCHLCQGLQEKLEQVKGIDFHLEVRDITTCDGWFAAYQYEVPVLCQQLATGEKLIPRPSPRTSVIQLEQLLQKCLS